MNDHVHQKVTADHLKRNAYLYIRQSTLRQVIENTESTKRQYALRQRAMTLGWPAERIVVIDSDQGQSGESAADREGFQKLVSEVSLGRAGIVLGLEVSRLARNCADWHRLLEICALSHTLILDEDGLYDPCDFNDRLLLGLKGAMSEAELHVLGARLQGGIRNKARRGALKIELPMGLVYDAQDQVVFDPDRQVQQAIRSLFQTYERVSSAFATVKFFRNQQLLFPTRLRCGPDKGQLLWRPLTHAQVLRVLHNPRYAGAFVFGRTKHRKTADGRVKQTALPLEQWHTVLPDAHPGYITWGQFQKNLQCLRQCAQAYGTDRRRRPPGQGPALLQGLVLCGVCGQRMTVRYHTRRRAASRPDYICQRHGIQNGIRICQGIPGAGVDQAIGDLLIQMVEPLTLEIALTVQQELQSRLDEADQLRQQQVERAQYEVELARVRFMRVDPNNRLVADALETEWNHKLRALTQAQEQYEQQRQADRAVFDEHNQSQIRALATDFAKLWHAPKTQDRERKQMARLLIEDVTLIKSQQIIAHVRFKGGTTHTLKVPRVRSGGEARKTRPEVVAKIDQLLDHHNDAQVAEELNRQKFRSGRGLAFTTLLVGNIRRQYKLKNRCDRLRDAGLFTLTEIAAKLDVSTDTVKIWQKRGLLRAHPYNELNQCLYEPVGDDAPTKCQGQPLSERRRLPEVVSPHTERVQYAT